MNSAFHRELRLPAMVILGVCSGLLSAASIFVRLDSHHASAVVWLPGLIFGLLVILPLSRSVRHGWFRTLIVLLFSTLMYAGVFRFVASRVVDHTYFEFVLSFVASSALGGGLLAAVVLWGRIACLRTLASASIAGGCVGAAAIAVLHWSFPPYAIWLAGTLAAWQMAVAIALWQGTRMPDQPLHTNRRPAVPPGDDSAGRALDSMPVSAPDGGR